MIYDKLKKWMAIIAIVAIVFPTISANATFDQNKAQVYLTQHADNPWSVIGLVAMGQIPSSASFLTTVSGNNAIDYEAPILAITAMGQNPRTFGSTDYVSVLKDFHKENQIGDATTINDDIFGILALISAGEEAGDPTIADAKNFILTHQNNNGGWGFTLTSDPDTNITSSAIVALVAAGVSGSDPRIQNALSFLQNTQNDDGGFPYSPGTGSDSSSTAWVLWALNSLNIAPASWTKSSNTPISFLESNQADTGYFKFQSKSSEDNFSAVTTAYAVIALQGKSLPIRIVSGDNSASQKKFSFRIEGSGQTVCSDKVAASTALDVVKNAKDICDYTYDIKDSNFGQYLNEINNDIASGMTGWMYLVNYIAPNVGAADYKLQDNDFVLWYFGEFGWQVMKLNLSSQKVDSGKSVTVTVEWFNNNSWSPLSGATIHFGSDVATTDANGQANIFPKDGFYKVFAEKQGYIRSNSVSLEVGQASTSVVSLSVNIDKANKPPEDHDAVSFTVTPNSLDFGKLSPGASSSKDLVINNTGTTGIHVETIVGGDDVFTQGLKLNDVSWQNFKTDISKGTNQNMSISLSIPQDYSGEGGAKSGELTVWAMAE